MMQHWPTRKLLSREVEVVTAAMAAMAATVAMPVVTQPATVVLPAAAAVEARLHIQTMNVHEACVGSKWG